MIKRLRQANQRRRYAQEVRRTRSLVSPGDRIRVIRGDGIQPATVLNVRAYAHGSTEAYVQGDGMKFAGWVAVDSILPFEEARL